MKIEAGLPEKLEWIQHSLGFFGPELILFAGIVVVLCVGIIIPSLRAGSGSSTPLVIGLIASLFACAVSLAGWNQETEGLHLFGGMIVNDRFSSWLKIICDVAGALTFLLSLKDQRKHVSEYVALVLSVLLGAHMLSMSVGMIMIFLSLEMISITSYVLAGYSFKQEGAEGSLKYFLFGTASAAVMLYGLSLLYGITGSSIISSQEFVEGLLAHQSLLLLVAGLLALAGFLFKMAALPMHLWAPDVYQAAPMPVVALFSVVPKLAGLAVLTRFVLAATAYGQSLIDWKAIVGLIAIVTITAGNVAALRQSNAKRMMAYSSIAQSGFLLIGVAALTEQSIQFMMFYAAVYFVANYLVFGYLQYFESKGVLTIPDFAGTGRTDPVAHGFLLAGLISLTGIPPTAGFTAKLLIFTGLYDAYRITDDSFLLWIFVPGLLNTVIALFYYLRIPYFAFLRDGDGVPAKYLTWTNFLGLVLVLTLLGLFFRPDGLMGWINKITFVL
ncbi:MAG: NADH-quinone oxidoreductase subunit N [Bacteroidota bacterium]|nr:MAG: NADH-quinone oxidoreductase subunit N [Bacteroidota bacterium]